MVADAEAIRWLRDALEGAGLALWAVEFTGQDGTIACSPPHAALLGLGSAAAPPGALLCAPVPLADWRSRVHPEDLPMVQATVRAAAAATEALPPGLEEGPAFRLAYRLLF